MDIKKLTRTHADHTNGLTYNMYMMTHLCDSGSIQFKNVEANNRTIIWYTKSERKFDKR